MASDWMKNFGIGSGLGSLAGGIFGMFNKQKNPSDIANQYLNQIPGIGQQYYNPWINAGRNSMGKTGGIYDQMSENPGDYYNKLGEGYKESPGYQFKLKQALQAGTNANAAGGMAGSPQHEQQNIQLANDIASQDFNDYLTQVLGINKLGLQGEENSIGRGFDASKALADMLGGNLSSQAQYGYAGQAGKNQSSSGNWNNIFSGIGAIAPWLF